MDKNKRIPKKFYKLRDWLLSKKIPATITFFVIGIASTIWFLIRVIPKPSRAGYPCMQVAAPFMSSFVLYALSLGGAIALFRSAKAKFKKAHYLTASVALAFCVVLLIAFNFQDVKKAFANVTGTKWERGVLPDAPNSPIGKGTGINPGRVVWAWDPEATNEKCRNTIKPKSGGWGGWGGWGDEGEGEDEVEDDNYLMESNNNLELINQMFDNSIMKLAGKESVKEAWDAIFNDFNKTKLGTASGYTEGQTIFIKVNNGQAGWSINYDDLSEKGEHSVGTQLDNIAMANTSPWPVLAIVRQLVDVCKIPQSKIYIGEPMTHVYKSMYDAINSRYPDVKILDKEDKTKLGRTTSNGWTDNVIFYSDKGDVMKTAIVDNMMKEMYNADYMINVAALKAHARNGVTFCAKNHFGSTSHGKKFGAEANHAGLICTIDNDVMDNGVRGEYSVYRVMVDMMGHEKLGRNTVLFVVDGLWGGIEATDMPVKWRMAPFNNDFPSSLFISQDPVAIESVCLDFLRAEADKNKYFNDRPFFPAVDDHLHQAADPANWPKGLIYDPENDGTPVPQLGVHEHWNNAADMQYSKNLGKDNGIELVKLLPGGTQIRPAESISSDISAFPNPCTHGTTLAYQVNSASKISLALYTVDGKMIRNIIQENIVSGKYTTWINTSDLKSGLYFCMLKLDNQKTTDIKTVKIQVK